ncbi:MAG TPA: EAL domain-containing protein [Pseudoxanthomonas sp.]|nr:EAL domain-containing protein [Pseudoxanthomonas sp.]
MPPEAPPSVLSTQVDPPFGNALHAALWENTIDVVLIIDADNVVVHANPRCAPVLGYAPHEVVGRDVSVLMPASLRGGHAMGLACCPQPGQRTLDWDLLDTTVLHRDGREVPVELTFCEVLSNGGRLFVAFMRDVSLRKQHEAQREADRQWAEATLRSMADAVVTLDLEGRIASLSVVAEHLTGWKASQAVGLPFADVVCLRGEDGRFVPPFRSADELTFDFPRHAVLVRRDLHEVPVEGTMAPIMSSQRTMVGIVVAFRNVAYARRVTAELSYQASHDGLTGLVNRKAFECLLKAAVARAKDGGESDALLYLDLDRFKTVNDTGGHVAGDALLQQLAGVLSARLRESDCIARLGGDEFGVLLHKCSAENAVRIAEYLRQAVADFTLVWQSKMYSVGVSIGVVQLGQGELTLGELLGRADRACYVAKAQGRNHCHLFTPDDQSLPLHRSEIEWAAKIRAALAEDRLFLCVHPMVAICGRVDGPAMAEVLLRMRGPDGQTIMPMAFIPAAERCGLMSAVDRWVIRAVVQHMAQHPDDQTLYCISLSGPSIGDPAFCAHVEALLESFGADPRRVCFGISETAAIANPASVSQMMRALRGRGVRFGLDDFGSRMSSFASLRQLPLDYLKIDGSLVRSLACDRVDRAMLESINHLAHAMGIVTIAQRVENEETVQVLREIGVHFAQGQGIARPHLLGGPLD